MRPKLIITFDRLSEADFLAKAGAIVAALTNNPNFPEPWPAQVPSLAQLAEALNAYREAYHASLTRDTVKIGQRDAARQTLTDMFRRLAPYLEMVAQDDAAMLATTGYDLRRESVRGNGDTLPAPADFRVGHGLQSGTLDVHVARLAGARSYEVHTAQGDPTVEANWRHALVSPTATRITLAGLKPAQTYWVRVRGIGGNGAGQWTDPAMVIVV